jgi:hypothetical protein
MTPPDWAEVRNARFSSGADKFDPSATRRPAANKSGDDAPANESAKYGGSSGGAEDDLGQLLDGMGAFDWSGQAKGRRASERSGDLRSELQDLIASHEALRRELERQVPCRPRPSIGRASLLITLLYWAVETSYCCPGMRGRWDFLGPRSRPNQGRTWDLLGG